MMPLSNAKMSRVKLLPKLFIAEDILSLLLISVCLYFGVIYVTLLLNFKVSSIFEKSENEAVGKGEFAFFSAKC